MELLVVNQTKYMMGAHATAMLVNEYVNKRLGSYGPAVEMVEVTLLYPPKRLAKLSPGPFDAEFRRILRLSPRATFYRAKRSVEIRCVCPGVSPRSIQGNGHLTFDETVRVTAAVAAALELAASKFKPADRFDAAGFVADACTALAECPAAIRRRLA